MKKLGLMMAATMAATMMGAAAHATVLYSNGKLNGRLNGWGLSSQYPISDSFTVEPGFAVTGVDFAAWLSRGATLNSIDWTITSGKPFAGGTVLASGTASPLNSTLIAQNSFGYQVSDESFSFNPVTLEGGAYYLELTGAKTSSGYAYWDQNNGPSSAYQGTRNLDYTGYDKSGSDTFEILGSPVSAAPEPSVWALMLAGVAMIGLTLRQGRRQRGMALAA